MRHFRRDTTLALQRDFQDAMKKYAPEATNLTHFHLEGYLCARVLVVALSQAAGRVSAATLSRAMRAASPMDVGGFVVDFRKDNEGSRWTDLAVISRDGTLRY